jgi:hypothetical protein
LRQFAQEVGISGDEVVLGDDHHRVTEVSEHLQTTPRQFQPPLDRLVRIGDAADGEHLRFPMWRGQLAPQEFWGILFDQNLGLEIKAS